MGITNLALFDALKSKMSWNQAQQKLLAENVANAETPGYLARELEDFSFDDAMKGQSGLSLTTSTTNARHISTANNSSAGFSFSTKQSFEVTPEGNGVVLENEMMKVTANQMDYQAATSLYSRSLQLLRTALGRAG